MQGVEKVSGGEVYVRGIGRFTVGDTAEVSDNEAAYLVDERGDFRRVDNVLAVEYEEADYESLEDLTYDELMERAREQNISGRSQMDKAALINALQED